MKLELQKYAEGKWDVLQNGLRVGKIIGGNRRYAAFLDGHQTHVHASKNKALQAAVEHIQMRADNHKKGIDLA